MGPPFPLKIILDFSLLNHILVEEMISLNRTAIIRVPYMVIEFVPKVPKQSDIGPAKVALSSPKPARKVALEKLAELDAPLVLEGTPLAKHADLPVLEGTFDTITKKWVTPVTDGTEKEPTQKRKGRPSKGKVKVFTTIDDEMDALITDGMKSHGMSKPDYLRLLLQKALGV